MSVAHTPSAFADDRYPMDRLIKAWHDDQAPRRAALIGLDAAFAACAIADLGRRLDRPILAVAPDAKRAQRLARDLALFVDSDEEDARDPGVSLYPEADVGPFHQASPDRRATMARLAALARLRSAAPPAVTVASPGALIRRTLPPASLDEHLRTWQVGDEVSNQEARAYFALMGMTEVPIVEDPGTFALRGDIIDVYSPYEPSPVRLERWGDEIAEIRAFRPDTQRTERDLDQIRLGPAREEILSPQALAEARERLLRLGAERGQASSSIQTLMLDMRAGVHFVGIDALLPALHPELTDPLAHLPDNALVVLVRPAEVTQAAAELWARREREAEAARQIEERERALFFDLDAYYTSPEALLERLGALPDRVDLDRVAIREAESGLDEPGEERSWAFRARPNDDVVRLRKTHQGPEQTARALAPLLEQWAERYGRIAVACRTPSQAARLVELLETFGALPAFPVPAPIDVSESLAPPAGVVEVYVAPLQQGFRSEMLGLCLIAGAEIFGRRVATDKGARDFTERAAIAHFRELKSGDLLVHVDFGIGRYRGIEHKQVEGVGYDFLAIEYAGSDKLYLPIDRLDRVTRYVGDPEHERLDKLGGTGWERTKERVKQNIREVAGELLALYAEREMSKGFSYSPPDETYHEFEERFPFEETPDQQRAIDAAIDDMTSQRPMDRLVCGDVGFGKTEVAIRAAMKAVLDGKQVAVLVPTTILAEQHNLSFRARMEEFGARVECISRFRSAKEAKAIIADTNAGKVDVLIGTHRLLNKSIAFRDLGLLIVDEEQRFGVTHKEKIKRLRADIDILTLTATPIPRTLQMSLLGIRDLSIIATPPHDRRSVRTHIAKFSDAIIREAVDRELARGGQIFFVHNRVSTIQEMAEHLSEVIPRAKIGIGHGQMPESELEGVMLRYMRNEINVLLCSSIIESGLDIPNANTIIVNRADLFGLSQLYQLRGRVGRGKERAYAYMLIPKRRKLPPEAEKRLDVIQTHTELGSGFHVASYDLEIRGAGSLLGDDQSGHVTAVGLDLYNELLEEAVYDLRGREEERAPEPEVNIPVPAYLPDDYIPATGLRLMFYKRFSLARTIEELGAIFDELKDRFGQPPESAVNLKGVMACKIGLRALHARKLDIGPSAVAVEFAPTTPIDPESALAYVRESRGRAKLTAEMKLVVQLKPDESARPLPTARALVDRLSSMAPAPPDPR